MCHLLAIAHFLSAFCAFLSAVYVSMLPLNIFNSMSSFPVMEKSRYCYDVFAQSYTVVGELHSYGTRCLVILIVDKIVKTN
jgi:hypothetical protein